MRDDLEYLDMEDLYSKLLEDILKHRYLYYVLHDPVINDEEYDKRERILFRIEGYWPQLTSKYSPSKTIGSESPKDYPAFIRRQCD